MPPKRARVIDHSYSVPGPSPSIAINSFFVSTTAGKRRKVRVVTQPYIVQVTGGTTPDSSTSSILPTPTSHTLTQAVNDSGATSIAETTGDQDDTLHSPPKKTGYARVEAFIPHFNQLQQAFMAQETEANAGRACSTCKSPGSAKYRCLECFNASALCETCIIARHRFQPLHQIQIWTGTHFESHSLHSLGFVMYLGHHGRSCPASVKLQEMVIVHTNGIHHRSVQFCDCNDLTENFQQLMILRLFPATLKFPATAFTFELLTTFHQLTLCSKITPYDYFDALKKLTDTAFPQDVDDRYKELMTVMRIWRHLAERRHSGQEHGIDNHVPHRRPNSLAVRCPACPEIGFNVDHKEVKDAPETATHKFTWFLSLDGNFRLTQMAKNSDPNDVPLNKGNAYFVDNGTFRDFLEIHDHDSSIQDSTCSKLKAVRQQQTTKFKNTQFSGVVASQCARHNFYLPQGIVNLVKGETYVRTDFALGSALGVEALLHRWIMVSYDIWCQYSIKLSARMENRFPLLARVFNSEVVRGAVPKGHIHGHGEKCQLGCSFTYTRFSGMTCGEGIETAWAEQNHAAGSTKEQSTGHRQDTLDDFNGYWNWTKLHRLSKFLLTQFTKYSEELDDIDEDFVNLSRRFRPEVIKQWKDMEARPFIGRDGKLRSLFQVDSAQVPSQRSQSERLRENSRTTNKPTDEAVALVEEATEIEQLQSLIRQQASTTGFCLDTLSNSRQDLHKVVDQWRNRYRTLFPQAFPHISTDFPENATLELPSSYSTNQVQQFGLHTLAQLEFEIRLGHAYDAINDLRTAIHVYNTGCYEKRNEVFGQKPNTRAHAALTSLKQDIRDCARRYSLSYSALIALGLPKTSELKPINDKDLWGKDMTSMRKLGDSKRKEPWYWVIGKPKDISDSAWEQELDRVRWFRTRAARDRYVEELEILDEEFKRTHCSFTRMNTIWMNIGRAQFKLQQEDPRLASGYYAFACRQAAMYKKLADNAAGHWRTARALGSSTHSND